MGNSLGKSLGRFIASDLYNIDENMKNYIEKVLKNRKRLYSGI